MLRKEILATLIFMLTMSLAAEKKTANKAGKVCEVRVSESSAENFEQALELARRQRDTLSVRSVESRRVVYLNLKAGSKLTDKEIKQIYDKAGIATDKIACMLL